MPIYEYRCVPCRHAFEELVLDKRHPPCPLCGGMAEKQLSVFAVGAGGAGNVPAAPAGCGSCGDPSGPGACSR